MRGFIVVYVEVSWFCEVFGVVILGLLINELKYSLNSCLRIV